MHRICFFPRILELIHSNIRISRNMSTLNNIVDDARKIYHFSVQAVQPNELIRNSIHMQSNIIEIHGRTFPIDKNAYIIGFGKAVLGMAVSLEHLLQDHLISGIISVPIGTLQKNTRTSLEFSKIKIFEGAQNNIPDNDSLIAANKIIDLVKSLEEKNLLFVLISGGGSALLPSPKLPLTLEEKQTVIKILASKGATIEELNCIRKRLSVLKGGGLAQLAKPAKVISLILSDIIGDPIGLIASGPTVKNYDDPSLPISILEKYNVKDMLPVSALKLLENTSTETDFQEEKLEFVSNFIIGNNTMALNAAARKAEELGYLPLIMTNKLCGLANYVGEKIVQLVNASLSHEFDKIMHICEELSIDKEKGSKILENLKLGKHLCLLFGGETTVEIKGKGTGGRNQELALASSIELHKKKSNVILLSAGTDGIDGPTDAAGAIATPFIVDVAKKEGLDAESFLHDNNSYNFYNSLQNGSWHIKIGHTGTNVMDIIIVLMQS